MTHYRQDRLDENLKRAIAEIICYEIRDKRIVNIVINSVSVSPDLHYASIYFSLPDLKKKSSALAGLKKAKKYIRYKLAQKLNMRYTPELRFKFDTLEVDAQHIEEVIEAGKERNSPR